MRIRRFASAILTAAVRRTSPQVRAWGEAMLREMDFVESDWAALFWAFGSAIALFRHLEAPMSSLSDIFSQTQALMKKIRRRTLLGYATCFVVIVSFGSFTFIFHNTVLQIGSGLIAALAFYTAYQLYEGRNRKPPSETKLPVCAAFYRTELERQRDFHRGSRFWSRLVIPIPPYIMVLVGLAITYPGLARAMAIIGACFVGLCVVAIPFNLELSRKYQRQIDELDALLKES